MRRLFIAATLAAALMAGVSFAHGQKQTERYIPIGQSPGVSGKSTWIGTVEATDPKARTITVAAADRRYTVAVAERTLIWLDRSRLKQTALGGSYGDLQPGRRVEVKYGNAGRAGIAEWIKVEM
jgi:opacity protein-like surface antigen